MRKIPQKEMGSKTGGRSTSRPLPDAARGELAPSCPWECSSLGALTYCSALQPQEPPSPYPDYRTSLLKPLSASFLASLQLILNTEAVMTLSLQWLPVYLQVRWEALGSLAFSPSLSGLSLLILLFTLLLAPLASFLFLNHSRTLLGPQGFCTCYFLFLFVLPANTCVTPSLPDFKSLSHFTFSVAISGYPVWNQEACIKLKSSFCLLFLLKNFSNLSLSYVCQLNYEFHEFDVFSVFINQARYILYP